MSAPDETPEPTVLDTLITPEEINELGDILLSCDADGMLDIGELDGFLSALAIAPKPSTLERWWAALVGHQPEWESITQAERARALVERYYSMVQTRVALAPNELGFAAIPPLWSSVEEFDENEEDAEEAYPDGDEELAEGNLIEHDPEFEEAPDWMLEHAADDDGDDGELILGDESDEADEDYAEITEDDDFDDRFEVGETWLSGFRYGLALQADDWRRVVENEPALAPWLYALWVAADGPADGEPIDDLPSLPPTAASPENAGFLALEATLKEHAAERSDVAATVETHLVGVIPIVLHQLWRRNRDDAGAVAAAIESEATEGELNQRDALFSDLYDALERIAVPGGGMSLERLDGYWSAWTAGPTDEEQPLRDLNRILGPTPEFEDEDDARNTLQGLMELWANICGRHGRALQDDDDMGHGFIHFDNGGDPEAEPDPRLPYGRDWAKGFLEAVEEFPRSAKLVLMDPEAKHWLAPIEALAEGYSLEKRKAKLGFDERMSLIIEIPECIAHLRGFWKSLEGMSRTPVRASSLPGRNDPCPCGSGKKYKKCHGAPDRLN